MFWPFKKEINTDNKKERKSFSVQAPGELGSFLMFGHNGATTSNGALNLYNKSTAVSIPINIIAESFASIEPVVKQNNIILPDHDVLDLLRKPSPFFTQNLFFEVIAKHYLITGNAYVVALGGIDRPPLQLQPISPSNVTEVEGSQGLVDRFIVHGNSLTGSYGINKNNLTIKYLKNQLSEIKQIRGFSTRNNSLLRGQSLLISASSEVRQHILGNTHNVSILERGGRVSLIFHFEEDMVGDDFIAVKDRIRTEYGGASKAGEIGVTSGGKLDIKEIGINNKEMDFVKLQEMVKRAIAQQYKVPLPIITIAASTLSNLSDSRLALYDDAVLPLADRIFSGLTTLLMPRYGEDPSNTKITYDLDSITALSKRRNEELKLRRDLNLESINELRAAIGREPVEGGDDILAPANLVPIGTDIFTDDNEENTDTTLARDN